MAQIYQLLQEAKAINEQENVNKLLLAHLLEQDLAWIYCNLTNTYKAELREKYLALVQEYGQGLPLGYLLGHVFFRSQKIIVDRNVLIPRSATELLVERTLLYTKKLFADAALKVLDLCTGSGCIAISLGVHQPHWSITASDISAAALAVAKINIACHQLPNIQLVNSDLFTNLGTQKFDVVVCNPPYIDRDSNTYKLKNLQHEPALALFAENQGLAYYQKIFSEIFLYTKKVYLLAFEIGFNQKEKITRLVKENCPNTTYWFEKDDQGHWRFLFLTSKPL